MARDEGMEGQTVKTSSMVYQKNRKMMQNKLRAKTFVSKGTSLEST